MSSSARSIRILVLSLFSLTMLAGPTACASNKTRGKWWQFWRPKKPRASSIYHPDRLYVSPAGSPGIQESIADGGLSVPLGTGAMPMPPVPLDELVAQLGPEVPIRGMIPEEIAELNTVHFAYDSSTLDPGAQAVLSQNVEWLRRNSGVQVQIEGHTDERGTIQYNMLLGEKRAKTVKAYLTAMGVDQTTLHTISYGEERPVDARGSSNAFSANRRAQFLVY